MNRRDRVLLVLPFAVSATVFGALVVSAGSAQAQVETVTNTVCKPTAVESALGALNVPIGRVELPKLC